VRTVQRGHDTSLMAGLVTLLAALLVLLVLNAPSRLDDLGPRTLLRLPLEALVLFGLVVALPSGRHGARRTLALAAGIALGLTAVFRLLDLGFTQALGRPFDPLVDWRYASSLVELMRDSLGDRPGTALLVVAAASAVALLVLVSLAVLRLTRVASRHRRPVAQGVGVLTVVWVVLALLGTGGGGGALAARDTAGYVYGQVSRIPDERRDLREFGAAAETDPLDEMSGQGLLTGLRGKDVLFVFVESLGRVALEDSSLAPGVTEVLASGTRRLERSGFSSRSAWLTSPTFGGISWLAHATLQSGLWVDSQQRYDELLASPRLTLTRLFARAGWRTVFDVPANTRDWPEGSFYGFDQLYDSRNVGYEGPRFGYATMPDQFTLAAFHRLELAPSPRRPVMAEIDLVSSHVPWSRTPWMIDWSEVGDGSEYDDMRAELPSKSEVWTSPERIRDAYVESVAYSLTALLEFVVRYGDDDLVVVFLGDHQPATVVSGSDAGWDVPIAVVARDPAVLDPVADWGWDPGLRPGPDAPTWRMDAFRDRFLAAYGPKGQSGPHG